MTPESAADGPRDEGTPPDEVPARPADSALPEAEPEASAEAPPGPETAETIDYKDRWLRAEAELQNFRRRARRDQEETQRFAEESVLLEIIGALDDLDRALEAAREAGSAESLIQGVELVSARLREYLARQGVTVLDPVGDPFDPTLHEALLEVEPPPGVSPGHVVQVALKGYRRGMRALRAARVVVARGHAGSGA
jgi:molecular chaperone GrpE